MMSSLSPRSSVFTFQSAVHTSWVLQCLNEQRLRDVLCDVTVLVQEQSFRAHASVLAACSSYFHSRLPGAGRQCPVITLPEEVTVEGFEPLLHFAYTSKLLFTKENIHAIHSCADFLGFHNLEASCFDFLLPKFSEGKRAPQACCQKILPNSATPSTENINSRQVPCEPCSSGSEQSSASSTQHPPEGSQMFRQSNTSSTHHQPESSQMSRQSNISSTHHQPESLQMSRQSDISSTHHPPESLPISSKDEHLCLENCGPEMTPLPLDLATTGVCPILSMQCAESSKADHPAQYCEREMMLDIGNVCNQSELADCGLPCDVNVLGHQQEFIEPAAESTGNEPVEILRADNNCDQCPFRSQTGNETNVSFSHDVSANLSATSISVLSQDDGFEDRSSVEREVAEHLAKGFWSELCPSQVQDPVEQVKMSKAADFHWLKQLDLNSSMVDCPFLRDMGTEEDQGLSSSLSQSERSPCASSMHSGDDSDMDTDGDTEANKKRAAEIQLPFPVEDITSLSRSAFQQVLRLQQLTPEQQEFVHDVRRRSKNRMAAQRCRKRKLDGIQQLQCDIRTLRSERERLLDERSQLEQSMEQTRQNLCTLNQCANLDLAAAAHSPSTEQPSPPSVATPMNAHAVSSASTPAGEPSDTSRRPCFEKDGEEGLSARQECSSIFHSLDMDSF